MPMNPAALRGAPASGTPPARLLHTLFVFIATSLMLIIAILSFLFTLFLKFIMPASAPSAHRRRDGERHVTFLEPSVVITVPTPPRTPARLDHPTPTPASTPTLSLTTTPHNLEPATPDVAEDPFRALSRICGFLASNSALAWKREELAVTPPLAGLEPYLAAVREDLARIEEMGEEDEDESESESEEGDSHDDAGSEQGKDVEEGLTVAVAGDSEVLVGDRLDAGAGAGASASEDPEVGVGEAAAVVGAGTGASADAQAEPDLVPDHRQATRTSPPPLPPSQLPTQPLSPDTSVTVTATSTPTPGSAPPIPPEPTAQNTASPEKTDPTPIATPSTSAGMSRRPPPPPPPPQTTSTTKRPPPPPPPPITTTPTPIPIPTPTPLANPGPRKRKDAVLHATRPTTITGPEGIRVLSAAAAAATTTTGTAGTIGLGGDDAKNATAPDVNKLADSDDAAVRAPALFSRVADLGSGLFEGTVRERGAALWSALSRGRSAPSDVPVPSMPRTRFATGAAERG